MKVHLVLKIDSLNRRDWRRCREATKESMAPSSQLPADKRPKIWKDNEKMNNSSAIDNNNNDKQQQRHLGETTARNRMLFKFYPPSSSVCLPVCLSVCLSVYLSVCLSLSLSLSLSLTPRKKSTFLNSFKMLWLLLLRRVTALFCYP